MRATMGAWMPPKRRITLQDVISEGAVQLPAADIARQAQVVSWQPPTAEQTAIEEQPLPYEYAQGYGANLKSVAKGLLDALRGNVAKGAGQVLKGAGATSGMQSDIFRKFEPQEREYQVIYPKGEMPTISNMTESLAYQLAQKGQNVLHEKADTGSEYLLSNGLKIRIADHPSSKKSIELRGKADFDYRPNAKGFNAEKQAEKIIKYQQDKDINKLRNLEIAENNYNEAKKRAQSKLIDTNPLWQKYFELEDMNIGRNINNFLPLGEISKAISQNKIDNETLDKIISLAGTIEGVNEIKKIIPKSKTWHHASPEIEGYNNILRIYQRGISKHE